MYWFCIYLFFLGHQSSLQTLLPRTTWELGKDSIESLLSCKLNIDSCWYDDSNILRVLRDCKTATWAYNKHHKTKPWFNIIFSKAPLKDSYAVFLFSSLPQAPQCHFARLTLSLAKFLGPWQVCECQPTYTQISKTQTPNTSTTKKYPVATFLILYRPTVNRSATRWGHQVLSRMSSN